MEKNSILPSQSIKHKLIIAASLMSAIPILILLNYVFPNALECFLVKSNIYLIIAITILISILGFILIKQVIDPIARISHDAKLIADGDIERRIEVRSSDEVGQLGSSLNQLTSRIKENINELKGYSSRAAQINLDIQKRMLVLSGLLQISTMISQGIRLDEILHFCVEKVKGLADSSMAFLLFLEDGKFNLKVHSGSGDELLSEVNLSGHEDFLLNMFQRHTSVLLDSANRSRPYERFASIFGVKNCVCLTIFLGKKPVALLGVGNNMSDFAYKNDDQDLLDVFAKQVAIAIENDLLSRRIEKLEIKDNLTGLYNERYIHSRLEEEIKRAIIYQRPCSFILAAIDNFRMYQNSYSLIVSEAMLKKVASCLSSMISGIDRLGRIGDFEFGIVLPEKNKRQAKSIAEEMQKKVGYIFKDEPEAAKRVTISIAIAENPLDGVSAEELTSCAQKSLPVSTNKQ